jgi:hypothetical protein
MGDVRFGIAQHRGVSRVVAVLITIGFVLCFWHGVGIHDDDHAALHAPLCAPIAALMVAGALFSFFTGTGWLIVTPSLAAVAVSLHLPDPPPKRSAR